VLKLQSYLNSMTIKVMAKSVAKGGIILAGIIICLGANVLAAPLKSTNYVFEETSLGGLGVTNTHSTHYQSATSGGILGFGNTADSTLQVNTGHSTTNDPALSFAVDTPGVNFGSFSPSTTATATSTFQVSDYTSYGYIIQLYGNAPNNGSHTITAMSSSGPSSAGTEQFGINLVANTSPTTFGATPNHGQFGSGSAAGNYATANNFIYNSGDTVATAPKSSGMTIYTISYIVNVGSLTPGGQYSTAQTLLCTATF
jgi:hypothetical protein